MLKKVDFLEWKSDASLHESKVMRRYHVQKREDYIKYNKICGQIRKLTNKLSLLSPQDPVRAEKSVLLLDKLFGMGLIAAKKGLSSCDKITVSAFCRRRLPIVMCRLKMAETVREAVTFVEQGRTCILFLFSYLMPQGVGAGRGHHLTVYL